MVRQSVPAARPWEEVGYSRAVRVGNLIEIAGTTAAAQDGSVVCPGDAYGQARECFRIITNALADLGALPTDVIRTRVFLKDISIWRDVGRAHHEFFAEAMPVSSFLEVSQFLDPGFLLEVEATAVLE